MARNGINNKLSIKAMFIDQSFMCVYLGICVGWCGCVTLCESARPTTPRTELPSSGENGGRKTAVDNQNRFLTFHSLLL